MFQCHDLMLQWSQSSIGHVLARIRNHLLERCNYLNLNVNKELGMDISVVPRDNPDYDGAQEESETQTSNQMLDVFDVWSQSSIGHVLARIRNHLLERCNYLL